MLSASFLLWSFLTLPQIHYFLTILCFKVFLGGKPKITCQLGSLKTSNSPCNLPHHADHQWQWPLSFHCGGSLICYMWDTVLYFFHGKAGTRILRGNQSSNPVPWRKGSLDIAQISILGSTKWPISFWMRNKCFLIESLKIWLTISRSYLSLTLSA